MSISMKMIKNMQPFLIKFKQYENQKYSFICLFKCSFIEINYKIPINSHTKFELMSFMCF